MAKRGVRAPGASTRAQELLVWLAVVSLATVLILATAFFPAAAPVACGVALYVMVLAAIGRERMVVLTMVSVFATAPMYKGIAASPSSPITPTDVLFGAAILLAAPTLITRRVSLPYPYVIGLIVVLVTSFVASVLAISPIQSLVNLVQWSYVLVVLPIFYVLWRPSARVVSLLLGSFVVGHVISTGWAFVDGPLGSGRYVGLSHHPNAFALGGMMSVAALLYLWHEHRSLAARFCMAVAAGLAVQSVLLSGSRAATLVVAALIVMVPIVERSAVQGFALAGLGALVTLSLPLLLDLGGEGSALDRFGGSGDVSGANKARETARQTGFDAFLSRPITGNGLLDVYLFIHDNLLEVAAAIGIFGLLGYLVMMFTLARPIFGLHRHRRLGYLVWAYLGVGDAIPSLWDLTIWVPMALVFLILTRTEETLGAAEPPATAEPAPTGSGPPPGRSPSPGLA